MDCHRSSFSHGNSILQRTKHACHQLFALWHPETMVKIFKIIWAIATPYENAVGHSRRGRHEEAHGRAWTTTRCAAARAQGRRSRGGAGAAGRPGTVATRSGRRPGQSVGAAAEDEAPARQGTRGWPRGSGLAGEGVASGRPPGTRRRRGACGGREDDEACGTVGQDDDATRGGARGARAGQGPTRSRGRRWRRRRRASAGAGAYPDDADLKLVRCRREGSGIVGGGGKVSAGWPYQPALTCPRWRQQYKLVPAGLPAGTNVHGTNGREPKICPINSLLQ